MLSCRGSSAQVFEGSHLQRRCRGHGRHYHFPPNAPKHLVNEESMIPQRLCLERRPIPCRLNILLSIGFMAASPSFVQSSVFAGKMKTLTSIQRWQRLGLVLLLVPLAQSPNRQPDHEFVEKTCLPPGKNPQSTPQTGSKRTCSRL